MPIKLRHSIQDIQRFLSPEPEHLQHIVLELHNMVLLAYPTAHERMRGKSLSYFKPEIGGPVNGALCGIEIKANHIRLFFVQGAFLPDPQYILEGERLAMRSLKIYQYEFADWDAIEKLIQSAAVFDWSSGLNPSTNSPKKKAGCE